VASDRQEAQDLNERESEFYKEPTRKKKRRWGGGEGLNVLEREGERVKRKETAKGGDGYIVKEESR